MTIRPIVGAVIFACVAVLNGPAPTKIATVRAGEAGTGSATQVSETLERLHAAVGEARSQWERQFSQSASSKTTDGAMEVRWFVELDGIVVPEDNAARARPEYPSTFLAVVYDRSGAILATLRRPAARAEDSASQDDLLFDRAARTVGHRHSYLSYVDCGIARVERVIVTVFDSAGNVAARTETLDADGSHALPPGCLLGDRIIPEVPRSARAALKLYGLGESSLRSPRAHPK